jgi:hypothetical protein
VSRIAFAGHSTWNFPHDAFAGNLTWDFPQDALRDIPPGISRTARVCGTSQVYVTLVLVNPVPPLVIRYVYLGFPAKRRCGKTHLGCPAKSAAARVN